MPINLTAADLTHAQALLDQGQVSAMYSYLSERGDRYATLANGVATGNTLSGSAAIEFMRATASQQGKTLSDADINGIRRDMAEGYLETLKQIAATSPTGTVTRDMRFDEAQDFHDTVFNERTLGPDAWTLNTPGQLFGPENAQRYWERLLDAAGDPAKEAYIAGATHQWIDHMRDFMQPPYNDMAASWSERFTPASLADILLPVIQDYVQTVVDFLNDALSRGWTALQDAINSAVNTTYRTSAATRPPVARDPLAIDLDGDGIETVGIGANPILFDHNADGIRTGTGWVRGDDGWLVLDRNGNGLIDSGRELFGVDTLLSGTPGVDAVYAATGFAALASLDANGDGLFNAADAAFSQVRIWQDSNQDGVSQAGELSTLAARGIASIGVNASSTTINLGNGNVVSGTATVTRTNGSTTLAETVSVTTDTTAANLDLSNNPFYREFTTPVPLTSTAQALPEMGGSGWVRDLREAMSLGTPQGAALAAKVAEFAGATTRDAQRGLLDDVLRLWAETNPVQALGPLNDPHRRFVLDGDTATSTRLQAAIPVLEVFNGMGVTEAGMQAPSVTTGGDGLPVTTFSLFANQAPIMLAAYDALRESVYSALVVQTRLQPYLDAVELMIDEEGVRFDTAAAIALVEARASTDAYNAVADLLDLKKYADPTLSAVGWQAYETLSGVLQSAAITPEIQALITAERIVALSAADTSYQVTDPAGAIVLGNAGANVLTGIANASDKLFGFGGNDTLNASGGGDTLDGGAGDDTLGVGGNGHNNNVTFIGGAGNDTLNGSYFGDAYVFNLGDGQDTISDYDPGYYQADVLRLGAGIAPADVGASRSGNDLVFRIGSAGDQITVTNWFIDGGTRHLERVEFADGAQWTSAQVTELALTTSNTGTAGADNLSGTYYYADTLRGLGGNDTLNASGGGDTLDGGAGDDTLGVGGNGHNNNVTFIGGAGNDTLNGSYFGDAYVFNLGDGQDTISDYDPGYYQADVLRLGAGIAPADVGASRSGNDLVFRIGSAGDQITVTNWFIDGGTRHLERVEFADGAQWTSAQVTELALTTSNTGTAGADNLSGTYYYADTLRGLGGNDTLNASGGGDTLDGGAGDDTLGVGGNGHNNNVTFIGGAGNDTLNGSYFGDAYVFNLGDGQDTISDYDPGYYQADVLRLGAGIAPADVGASRSGNDLVFRIGSAGDQITVTNWFSSSAYQIERVEFANGVTWTAQTVSDLTLNQAPTVAVPIPDQATAEDSAFTFAFAANTFTDPDVGTTLSYTASLASGAALPSWLTFNASTRTFSGTPANADVGNLELKVVATDPQGAQASDVFVVAINNTNDAPTVAAAPGNQAATEGQAFTWTVPAGTFVDVDAGDTLVRTLTRSDGSALPTWLSFNAATGILSGTPDNAAVGTVNLRLTGTDSAGAGASANFNLAVANVNDAPTLVAALPDQTGQAGVAFSYTVPASAFTDIDVGDTLTYSAAQAGGAALPSWLSFNTSTRTFSGTPPAGQAGTVSVRVTATDTAGASTNDVFDLSIALSGVINGTAAGETLNGTAGQDQINGLGGNDTLNGLAGDDVLDGGTGNDTLVGGAGNDTYVIDSATDVVTELANEGTDTVQSGVSYSLANNVENLTLTGNSAINGTGNTLANVITGNSAANTLDGGTGADTLIGGAGNDTYVVDNTGDVITELTNEGTEAVNSSVTYTLAANIENLTLTGATAINGTGNALDNVLTGNSANNILTGGAGNDTIDGGAGNDTLVGGAGNDTYIVDSTSDAVTELTNEGTDTVQSSVTYTLANNVENLTLTGNSAINATGNALDNILTGNSAANVLTGGAGNDTYYVSTGDTVTEAASAGTDTVVSSVTWTLGSNLENLTLSGTTAINGTGNTVANVLTGNSAANILDGGTGADTLTGGAGNDTYVVDNTADVITELANEGTDAVNSSVTYTLAANIENLTLTGTTAINGTGNALDNVLTGNSANNTLTGGAGNDTIDGGTGNDTMVGGSGNDTYTVNVTTDVITELAGEGTDTVLSSVTWTLGNNLENLTLLGTTAINGTGNTLDNILTGNSANNTLTGGAGNDTLDGAAGNDTMLGGSGNDTYVVNVTTDVVTENANEGTDTVQSSVAWTLGNNLENLTLLGTTAINGTGNTLNNMLLGNAAANTLTGNAGDDTLDGGAGADVLTAGTGNDTYVMGRGYGAETLQENDATAGNADVLQFLSGVSTDQIWLRQVSNNLEVSIIGSTDKVTLSNWYLGNQYHVEQFRTADGHTLLDSSVQSLVNAMAAFAPPAAGQTTLPANYQAALAPVLASSWGG